MAKYLDNSGTIALQAQALKDQRERDERAAVASGNVDENSALYRHAKLNGWDLGGKDELHGPARANAVARDRAATDIVEQRAAGAPRSAISGFGANMDTGRFTRYNADGSVQELATPAQQMFQQMGQLVERGKAERQRKRNLDDAALASGMIYAKQGNGFIPPDMLQALSSQLGQEITGGNYTADGNFVLYGSKEVRDPGSGRVVRNGMSPIAVASPEMQMRILQRSGLGQGLQEQLWDYMTAPGRLTPQQVRDRGFTDPRAAQRDAEAKERRARFQMKYEAGMRSIDRDMEAIARQRDKLGEPLHNADVLDALRTKKQTRLEESLRKEFPENYPSEEKPQTGGKGESGGEAKAITRKMLDKAIAAGAKYDEKAKTLTLNGKTIRFSRIED